MRIIVDCTGMDFNGQLSGIPRVVYNYLRYGFAWSLGNDIEIVPIYVEDDCAWVVEDVPGVDIPDYVSQYHGYGSAFARRVKTSSRILYRLGKTIYQIPYFLVRTPTRAVPRISRNDVHRWLQPLRRALNYPASLATRLYREQGRFRFDPDDVLFCPASWYDKDIQFYVDARKTVRSLAVLSHDILPVTNPEYYNYPWSASFAANVGKMLEIADVFFTVSAFTKQSIMREYIRESANMPFCIAHNCLDKAVVAGVKTIAPTPNTARIDAECSLPPYLMVGSIEPKKGHLLVVSVLEKLWSEGEVRRKLLVIGRCGWLFDRIADRLKTSIHKDNIVWITDATDDDVSYAYQKCYALLFASVFEGFGLPLIECATARKPILARSSEVAHEIIGRFALYFDGTYPDLHDKILELEREDELYRAKIRELDDFAWPVWEDMVPEVFSVCAKTALGEPAPQSLSAGSAPARRPAAASLQPPP